MIRVDSVHKTFGSFHAVRGVSFEIPKGQCVGLLGPNGAGKTTTIRMMTGFLPPSSGKISIGGHDTISAALQARALTGYLPEATPLYPEMRVLDYLQHRAQLYSVPRVTRRRAIQAAADRCRLSDVLRRRIGHLSKGYRQRVGLAAALVHEPQVLILDEPSNGLDPSQIRETRSLIRDLAENRTVLVCSHILPEVERTCDRVIIFAGGRVRADGTPGRLVNEFANRQSTQTCTLEVHAPDAAARESVSALLRSLPGVSQVQSLEPGTDGWVRLRLHTSGRADDLGEPIITTLHRQSIRIRELGRDRPTLEHVFVSLIESDVPNAQPGAAA